jgi:hypothetical protein
MDKANTGSGLRNVLITILAISFLVSISAAQLGEVAGVLGFQVQVGHNETVQLQLLNEGSTPIGVTMIPPYRLQLMTNSLTAVNQITPTLYISPRNLTISPHGTYSVNITIYMPLNDTPNWASWEGILSAQEVSNATNPGGAVVLEGVAKIFSVVAIPSTTTTSTIPPTTIPTIPPSPISAISGLMPVIAIVLVVVGICAYYYVMKKNTKAQKAVKPVAARKTKRRPAGKARKKGRKRKAKPRAGARKRRRRRRRR